MKRFLIGIMLIIASFAQLSAQTTTGKLTGTVSSPDGVLPGATVVALDKKTGKSVSTIANNDGTFLFSQLEFGTYDITITNDGFKKYVANDVKIDVGRTYTLNSVLEIGGIQEVVEVQAGADVITANTSQVSSTVSPEQILSLPLVTRNPLTLAGLQAGVSANTAQNTTINGMRTTFTNITRDGINIQDAFIRSNATDFAPGRPSVDDTGEFTIATSNTDADQGYGGAQIRLVTPRGTKDFHGALFAYNRNSAFAANSFFNNRSGLDRPFRNRNQFGGKLSGPLPVPGFGEGTPAFFKDKGYFFFAYENIKDPQSSRYTRTILTPSAQQGIFTYNRVTAGAAIDQMVGTSRVQCAAAAGSACTISNILAFGNSRLGSGVPTTIDPIIQSRVLSQLPTTSNTSGGDGLNTAGFTLNRQANQTRPTYTTRVDFDITENDSVNFVYSFNSEENLRPDVTGETTNTVVPNVTQSSTNKTFVGAYRRILGSNFVNEFRGGIFTSEVPFDRTDAVPSYFLSLPLITNPENTFLSQGRNTKSINFQDNADLIAGKHSLRFGGQMQIFKVNSYNDASIVPVYTVGTSTSSTPTFTSTSFSSIGGISTTQLAAANNYMALLGGFVSGGVQSFNVADLNSGFEQVRSLAPFRYENYSVYAFDRWAATKNLTISAGIRYEIYPALRLANGLALEPVIADPDNPVASLLDPKGTYNVIGTNSGRKNAYYKTDYNNFAPNIGFSYSPDFEKGIGKFLFGGANRSVIRGGYSWVYGNDSIVTSINNAGVGNRGLGTTSSNALRGASTFLNDRLTSGVTAITPPALNPFPTTYLQNNSPSVGGNFGTVYGVDPNLQVPRIEQYSFGIQRELGGNMAFEIRYVGTRSKNLGRATDLNQINIFNNGYLDDFLRAAKNDALTGNAFCTAAQNAGCQALTLFRNTGAGTQPFFVGTGGTTLTTFNNNLRNGTPADLALNIIQNDRNNHPTVANPNKVPFVNFLPNPATGVVDYFNNDSFYNYNSLQLELRRRFSNGLYFQANYTFSKNLTNSVGTSQSLFEPYLDNNNKQLDKQRADFDLNHVFNFNGIYQLPFGKGKSFINNGGLADLIFGGWEVSGIVQMTSGAPITFVDTRGTLNRSGRSGRQTVNSSLTNSEIQNLVGVFYENDNVYFINPSVLLQTLNATTGRYSSTASQGYGSTFAGQVFFNTKPGETGNLGRSIISGPKFFNVDMALLKNIRIRENMRIQLRGEAFNLLNNVNFNISAAQQLQSITSTSFGQFTGTSNSSRQVQFAARFEF
ncbi:MAG: carboxypeptidase regulatory-like domain-containing protein [Acidobacteria bacterium]|nr:carboxypeptidase regulatory-like domain-containing protein [Acidobacteriota bacterium]